MDEWVNKMQLHTTEYSKKGRKFDAAKWIVEGHWQNTQASLILSAEIQSEGRAMPWGWTHQEIGMPLSLTFPAQC